MDSGLKIVKQQVIVVCREQLTTACEKYKLQMASLQESLGSEAKSTAGDKHETGRAMVQLEMERAAARWKESEEMLQTFERLAFEWASPAAVIKPGSIVQTSGGVYYLSVSLGMLTVEGQPVGVISMASPVGMLLKGKKPGETFTFNGVTRKIIAVF